MRNNLHLNLIYNFLPTPTNQGMVNMYRVLHFFSEVGNVSRETLRQIYRNYPQVGPEDCYCFSDLDDMGKFAVQVCTELASPEVFIISAQDYNLGLDSCADVRSFREIFRRYGTVLENPENTNKKKNLFGKIFD